MRNLIFIIVLAIVVVMVIKNRKQQAAEQAEADKKASENAAKEKQKAIDLKKKKLEETLRPSCESGDCWWFGGDFYFTCPADCDCERKTYTKNKWAHKLPDARLIPYMKRLEKAANNLDEKEKIYKDFMDEFLKQYGESQWKIADAVFSSRTSQLAEIAFWLSEQPALGDFDMGMRMSFLSMVYCDDENIFYNPIFKNISLYNRSSEDFEYSVKIIIVVLDKSMTQRLFKDTSNISLEQLLDVDGNVLEAGLGGPEEGFYGACIYNVVNSWAGEYGENYIEQNV